MIRHGDALQNERFLDAALKIADESSDQRFRLAMAILMPPRLPARSVHTDDVAARDKASQRPGTQPPT